MYAAIAYVDKQSFPFSDVLRVCFSEIANHDKMNGAKDVSLIAGNIFARLSKCILLLALPAPTLMSAVHLSKEETTRGRIRSVHIFTVHEHSSSVNTELQPASESQTESFYNYANQVTLKSHRSHNESHSESHNEFHSESHSESQTDNHLSWGSLPGNGKLQSTTAERATTAER